MVPDRSLEYGPGGEEMVGRKARANHRLVLIGCKNLMVGVGDGSLPWPLSQKAQRWHNCIYKVKGTNPFLKELR